MPKLTDTLHDLLAQLVDRDRWSSDTEYPGSNPSAASELLGCVLEPDTFTGIAPLHPGVSVGRPPWPSG